MAEIQKQTKLEQKKRIWHYKHFYVEHRVCVRCAVQIIINYISVLFLFFIHSIHSMLTQLSFLFVHSWHVKHTSFWSVCPTALFWAKQAYSKQSLWSFKTTKKNCSLTSFASEYVWSEMSFRISSRKCEIRRENATEFESDFVAVMLIRWSATQRGVFASKRSISSCDHCSDTEPTIQNITRLKYALFVFLERKRRARNCVNYNHKLKELIFLFFIYSSFDFRYHVGRI